MKLIQINKMVWVFATIFLAITFVVVLIALNWKIETSIKTIVIADGYDKKTVLIDSDAAYKINRDSKLTFKINKSYYSAGVKNISWKEDKKMFEIELSNFSFDLIPGSTLQATLIYDTHKVMDELFGSV